MHARSTRLDDAYRRCSLTVEVVSRSPNVPQVLTDQVRYPPEYGSPTIPNSHVREDADV